MAVIQKTMDFESIDCEVALWRYVADYQVLFSPSGTRGSAGESETWLDPSLIVQLDIDLKPEDEISVEYSLPSVYLAPIERQLIDYSMIANGQIPFSALIRADEIASLERHVKDRTGYSFKFQFIVRRRVSLDDIRAKGLLLHIVDDQLGFRRIRVSHSIRPMSGSSTIDRIDFTNYRVEIGNFATEIISKIEMFAGNSEAKWALWIDAIGHRLEKESLREWVEQAMSEVRLAPLLRVPELISRKHPTAAKSYQLHTVIDRVSDGVEYEIVATTSNPAQDLFYPTGHPDLDETMRHIHLFMFNQGLTLGPESVGYHRILRHLVMYRYNCGSVKGYIDPSIVDKSEIDGFHRHFTDNLVNDFEYQLVSVMSEASIARSRVDLLVEGLPIELKLEVRRNVTTQETIDAYKEQAGEYIAQRGAPFGFLVVLDTVLDHEQIHGPSSQDIQVVAVPTQSGGTVTVIGIVVRISRPASDFSKPNRKTRRH